MSEETNPIAAVDDDGTIKVDFDKMPFKSKAQMRFLYATNPQLAKKYQSKTSKQPAEEPAERRRARSR